MSRIWIAPDPRMGWSRSLVPLLGMPSVGAVALAPVIIHAAWMDDIELALLFGLPYVVLLVLTLPECWGWRALARRKVWIEDDLLAISIPGESPVSYRRDEILSIRLSGYFGWRSLFTYGSWKNFPSLSIHGQEIGVFLLWRGEADQAREAIRSWWKAPSEHGSQE